MRVPPIDIIGIVTAKRPVALARCLASYARNAAAFDRRPVFLVLDDAVAHGDRLACIEASRAAASPFGARVAYVGAVEKRTMLCDLASTGAASPDVVEFAFSDAERINRSTNGANRNVLSWFSHGRALLAIDDDTVCETYRPIGFSEEVVVRAAVPDGLDPSQVWPLGADDVLQDACRAEPVDVLGEHERWLGASVGGRRVLLTVNGLLGDCGWGSPAPYLFLREPSLDRVGRSDACYRAATTSRRIVRGVRQPVLSERVDDFMSGFFGLDNRQVVPPFFPVCRGADRVFARAVSLCGCGWFAHLPLVLRHEPLDTRRFWPGEIRRSAAGIDLSTLLCVLFDALAASSHEDPGSRLVRHGSAMAGLGSRARGEFRDVASAAVRAALARQADELEARAQSAPQGSPCWRRDTLAYAAALRKTLGRADSYVPLDVRLGRTIDEAEELTRRLVARYGRLLACWPDLLKQAARLHPEGVPITEQAASGATAAT